MILNMMKPASLSVVASTSYVQGTRATPGLESKSKHFEKKMSRFMIHGHFTIDLEVNRRRRF